LPQWPRLRSPGGRAEVPARARAGVPPPGRWRRSGADLDLEFLPRIATCSASTALEGLATIKEAVDNSLDACEGWDPPRAVEVRDLGLRPNGERSHEARAIRRRHRNNGPGIVSAGAEILASCSTARSSTA
jgi:hypothetical protein